MLTSLQRITLLLKVHKDNDNIRNGLGYIRTATVQNTDETYPSASTPHNDIAVQSGELIVAVDS